jgi:hypothetical protein
LYPAVESQTPAVLEVFMDYYKTMNRKFPWQELIELACYQGKEHVPWGKVIAAPLAREDNIVAILQREYHLWDNDNTSLQESLFKNEVKKNFTKVMCLMIEQDPQIVHDAGDCSK